MRRTKLGRVIDLELLKKVREMPCRVCGRQPSPGNPNDPDHIRTRGSGGGDTENNLWALCRFHHIEKGRIGIKTFAEKYKLPVCFDNGYPELILTKREEWD